ncbi:MAG: gamma-glutamyltransferase [Pirellulaceae bacterium]
MRCRCLRVCLITVLIGSWLGSDVGAQDDVATPRPLNMVSSAHPLATEAGVKVLQDGGNAFDAAVAIAATLNVVEPMNSGMGGYGTILIYDAKSKQVQFLDSSGKIPMAVDSDVFREPTPGYEDNRTGPKSVSTPGNVNAWQAMSQEYGELEWAELFQPAIEVAENGFTVTERLEQMVAYSYRSFPDHAKAIYSVDGKRIREGDLLVQADLAGSLRLVADQGARVFYDGELAEQIHEEMQVRGSFLSIEDLRADRAEWWEPAEIDYHGVQVYTASPPATAFPSLIRLGMMSCVDRSIEGRDFGHNGVDYLHYFAEITKHAFWCRLKYAGDPEIQPPPLDLLFSKEYWQTEVDKIDADQATVFEPPGLAAPTSDNTTHFVVADRHGNIVSATQTLGNLFGSRIMPPGTGIWFNNSLAYCTFEPAGNPMDAKPGQRKLSGDCPTIIFRDSKPWAALGTPGGHTIGQTVPQMVMNLVDFDMTIEDAIAAPRVSFMDPNRLLVENTIADSVVEELKRRGHEIQMVGGLGNAQGLRLIRDADGNGWYYAGAADPRGEGTAKGF